MGRPTTSPGPVFSPIISPPPALVTPVPSPSPTPPYLPLTCDEKFEICYNAAQDRCERQFPPPAAPPFDDWRRQIDACLASGSGAMCRDRLNHCLYVHEPEIYVNPHESPMPQPTVFHTPPPTPSPTPTPPPLGLTCEQIADKCAERVMGVCWNMVRPPGISNQEFLEMVGRCYEESEGKTLCKRDYDACVAARNARARPPGMR